MAEKKTLDQVIKQCRAGVIGRDGSIEKYVWERTDAFLGAKPFRSLDIRLKRNEIWQDSMSIYLLSTLGLKDPVARRRYLERFGTRVPAKALEELPDIEPADEAVMGFLRMPVKKYLEGLEALEIRKNPGKAARIRRESDHRYEYFSQDIECWKELYGKDDEPTVADVLISAEEILCFSPAEVKVLNGMMYEDESSEDRIPFRRKNGEDTYWPVSDAEQSLAACRVWILLVEGTGLTYI